MFFYNTLQAVVTEQRDSALGQIGKVLVELLENLALKTVTRQVVNRSSLYANSLLLPTHISSKLREADDKRGSLRMVTPSI